MADIKQAEKKMQDDSSELGGVSSPTETIRSCFELTDEIVKHKGTATPVNRVEVSVITGKALGTLIMKLSSCVQFGILNSKFGKGYQPSSLYDQYVNPIYEEDKKKVLLRILIQPDLYKRLIDEFNGKILPSEPGLVNHLKGIYKLNANSAIRAAKIFLENLRFVGVLDNSNRLRYITPIEGLTEENNNVITESVSPSTQNTVERNTTHNLISSNSEHKADSQLLKFDIPLSGNKTASFSYPKMLLKKDMKIIVRALNFIASSTITDSDDIEIKLIEETKKENEGN